MFTKLAQAAAATVLLSTAAAAADLPRRAAPPVYVPPVFTWTGFYIGTQSGYAFSDDQRVRTRGNTPATAAAVAAGAVPASVRLDHDGFVSGGGLGYDYQLGAGSGVVIGVAADATYMDLVRRRDFLGAPVAGIAVGPGLRTNFKQSLDYLGTVRGRIGYGFDRFLVYATGGFAFGGVEYRTQIFGPGGGLAFAGRRDDMETGYVYGGGVEYAIPSDSFLGRFNLLSLVGIQSSGFTVKAEYLRYDLGRRNVTVAPVGAGAAGSFTSRFETEGSIVRGGFTYRFGGLGF